MLKLLKNLVESISQIDAWGGFSVSGIYSNLKLNPVAYFKPLSEQDVKVILLHHNKETKAYWITNIISNPDSLLGEKMPMRHIKKPNTTKTIPPMNNPQPIEI